tara:strand:+ start:1129 stop:1989 length:861 start_codon:yes stop_codon:yes gene_type:complete
MKRDYITMGVALIAIILAIVAISSKPTIETVGDSGSDTLAKIRTQQKLDVCYAEYPPAVIKDANTGELSGHSVDTIELIAEQIGAKITYHESTWGGAAADVQTGRCDVMLTYFNQIPRSFTIAFTDPMIFVGDSALVRADDGRFSNVDDIMEFDKSDITVAVANGESGHNFVKDNFENAKVEVIDVEAGDLLKFLSLVQTGRADVGIADSVSIALYQQEHPDTMDLFANNPFNLNPTAYGVRQEDIKFLNFLNDALLTLEVKGKITELEQKYDAHWLHEKREYVVS